MGPHLIHPWAGGAAGLQALPILSPVSRHLPARLFQSASYAGFGLAIAPLQEAADWYDGFLATMATADRDAD
ncbi:hypothetical protein [Sphingomonas sp.]|uniref:hypothetical protein n=1 Tax=Sphingomonas sp. TaxID=28214 RepID=UPI003CC68EC4